MTQLMLTLFLLRARRLGHEDGQTMAEYGVLLAVIAIIVVVAATLFGANVSSLFSSSARKV